MQLRELGSFLRVRRAGVRPKDVGIAPGQRRRVPGLRREEVAMLAGASSDYYIQLERGQAQPSEQMLAALARALRLTSDERDHLFHLAGRPVPAPHGPAGNLHPALLDLLTKLENTPARVISDLGVVLAQNPAGGALLGEPAPSSGPRSGSIYRWFTEPGYRLIYPVEEHSHHSRQYVSDLRVVAGRRGGDDDVQEVLRNLLRYSEEFAALWELQHVAVRRSDRKRIVHPAIGVLDLNCLSLFSEDQRQRLLWFTAPAGNSTSAEQLQLLAAIGTQDFQPSERL
ncbi:MmyB family transcriptional regulator [Nesterenkonia haasae]|uniref:MmyB family transcriptional regulator n=1 Tax=Nesterenkonia haasae TaxID=2587813 RepID=UPI001391AB5C|nr:helix-turn-helix domain-containing protein [Nesterenkonia haasae]NDK31519.1 helix-turn-helix domain-containing protein [Nesterenkonia haasae]